MPLFDRLADVAFLLGPPVLAAFVLWRASRLAARARRVAQVAQEVADENATLRAELSQARQNLSRLERCNYNLACELYGQEAVDRLLREAAGRGAN